MSKNRYSNTEVVDGKFYKTFAIPSRAMGLVTPDFISSIKTREHVYVFGERLDQLAAKFLGDDQYWWIIALINGINYPFPSGGLTPGRVLRIPINASDVLNQILR